MFYWAGQRRVLWLLVLLMVIAIVAGGSHYTTTGQPNPKVIMDKSGTFEISVYESASHAQVDTAAIALGAKGSDVAFDDQGGTYYLQVSSECNWHVIVK